MKQSALTSPHRTKNLATLATFGLIFVIAFFPTFASLHQRWSSWTGAYSHGYLMVGVAVYLFHESTSTAPQWLPPIRQLALVLLCIASLSWTTCYIAGFTSLQQLLLPAIAAGMFGSLLDKDHFWRTLLPIGLIGLAIPIWDEILTPTLQVASTTVAAFIVAAAFDIPTTIDGFHITIPAGTFEVASGCSGLVFLLSATALGAVYGQLFVSKAHYRAIAIVTASALGILVNWIRIVSLIVIGQTSQMRHPLITEGHLLFGWYIFSAVMFVVIGLTYLLPATAPPHQNFRRPLQLNPGRQTALTLLALLVGPVLAYTLQLHSSNEIPHAPARLGRHLAKTDEQNDGFEGAALNVRYRYLMDPDISLGLVYYPNSFGRGKLISQNNHSIPPHAAKYSEKYNEHRGDRPPYRSTIVQISGDVRLIWDWYELGDISTAITPSAKIIQLKQVLRGQWGGVYMRLDMRCRETGCQLEQSVMERHAAAIYNEAYEFVQQLNNS